MQLKLQICRNAATPRPSPPLTGAQFASCCHKASNHAANEAYAQFLFSLFFVNIAYNKNEFKNHFKFAFSIEREREEIFDDFSPHPRPIY